MGNIGRLFWSNGPLLCVLTVLLWSGHFIAGRIAGDQLDVRPFQLAFFRFFCATVLLSAFMAVTWFTGRRETIRRDLALIGKHWWKLAPLGILGHGIFVSLVYFSLYTGQVPTIAVLQTTMPAVVVAAGFVLFRDRLTLWQSIGTSVCFLGAVLVACEGVPANLLGLDLTESVLWMSCAIFAYSVFTVLLRIRPDGLSDLGFLWILVTASALFIAPFFALNVAEHGLAELRPGVVGAVIFITLGPGLTAAYFWNRGVQLIGSNQAGVFINLMPVFAGGMAFLVLREPIYWYHLAGLAVIIGGITLVTRKRAGGAAKKA